MDQPRLSIVIICWNDRKVIEDCLRSIYQRTARTSLEVIVSDNGSADDSVAFVRASYPRAIVVENGANIGFARGNNAGIRVARGDYVLILNPDTIVHEGALDTLVGFAERHPEAGAFGCLVLNPDGSYQESARPFPTVAGYWGRALGLGRVAAWLPFVPIDRYAGWRGKSEREIDWQTGCCVMFRGGLLARLGGFDERFFYHFEETDLCLRVRRAGSTVRYTPEAKITHLGGQSVGRFPIRFEIEKFRNQYRYFFKHFGRRGLYGSRRASVFNLRARLLGYGLLSRLRPSEALSRRLEMYRVVLRWNTELDAMGFIEAGREPPLGYEPLAPAPQMIPAAPAGAHQGAT